MLRLCRPHPLTFAIIQNNTRVMDTVFECVDHRKIMATMNPSIGIFQGWAHYRERVESLEQRETLNQVVEHTARARPVRKM